MQLNATICAIGLLLTIVCISSGCEKSESLTTAGQASDYYPLQTGHRITYRLDSTVYIALNTIRATRSYIVQDRVEAETKDNLGQKAFVVRRWIRSNTDTTQWTGNAAYLVVPLRQSIEIIDDNLRYIRIQQPLRNDFAWKGHRYINTLTDPHLQYLDDWTFTYAKTGQPFMAGTRTFNETVTVNQRDEVINNPNDKTKLFSVSRSVEVYAKGVGLIYRDFLHETWQPPNASSASGYFESNSYGIRLTYLNHN
jgi:hypothetical protein